MEKGAAHTRRPLRHGDAQTLGVVPPSVDWVVGCAGVAGVAPLAGVAGVAAGALVAGVVAVPFTDAGFVAVLVAALVAAGFAADLVVGFLVAGFVLAPRSSATIFSPRVASSSYSFSALAPNSVADLRSCVGRSFTCSCTWANVGSA